MESLYFHEMPMHQAVKLIKVPKLGSEKLKLFRFFNHKCSAKYRDFTTHINIMLY